MTRTKNRPILLERALRDVLGQSLEEWHLVVVNDGGDPVAVDTLVSRYESRFRGRLSVIHNAESVGMEAASNLGVLSRSSMFIAIHDDDDTWDARFLEKAAAHLGSHPDECGVVAPVTIIWEMIDGDDVIEVGQEPFLEGLTDVLLSDHMLHNRFVPISLLYRRSVHDEIGLYRDDLPVTGDWEFHIRMLSRFRVGRLSEGVRVYWHQRRNGPLQNSVVAEGDVHRRYDGLLRNEHFVEYVQTHGPGLPLYLTGFIDGRLVQVEQGITKRIEELERTILEQQRRIEERTAERLVPRGLRALIRRALELGYRPH